MGDFSKPHVDIMSFYMLPKSYCLLSSQSMERRNVKKSKVTSPGMLLYVYICSTTYDKPISPCLEVLRHDFPQV